MASKSSTKIRRNLARQNIPIFVGILSWNDYLLKNFLGLSQQGIKTILIVNNHCMITMRVLELIIITSEMIDRVESNPKPSHFERVFSLDALLQALYTIPIFFSKASIIGCHQSWSLEPGQVRVGEVGGAMLSLIHIEPHCLSSCIVSILNHLLRIIIPKFIFVTGYFKTAWFQSTIP